MKREAADGTETAGTTQPAGACGEVRRGADDGSQGSLNRRHTTPAPISKPPDHLAHFDGKAELARIRADAGLPARLDPALTAKVSAILWPRRTPTLSKPVRAAA